MPVETNSKRISVYIVDITNFNFKVEKWKISGSDFIRILKEGVDIGFQHQVLVP